MEELGPTFDRLRTGGMAIAAKAPNVAAIANLTHWVGRRLSMVAIAIDEVCKPVPPDNTRATRATSGRQQPACTLF